jgi:molecular chaperone IbpA
MAVATVLQKLSLAHLRSKGIARQTSTLVASKKDYIMRHFDLTPFHRSTIGFDRLFSLLDQASGGDAQATSYPPYNIERTAENTYRISIAVAGFSDSEIVIEATENQLTVKGEKSEADDNANEILFRGIAARAFERRFQLADYVTVSGARLENGLLHIELVREIPEAKKPRVIAINTDNSAKRVKPKAITSMADAA